jgi:hypothetical protein
MSLRRICYAAVYSVMLWCMRRLTKAGFMVWYPCSILPGKMTMKKWSLEAWRRPWSALPIEPESLGVEYVIAFTRQGTGRIAMYSPYRYVPHWDSPYPDSLKPVSKV